MSKKENRNTLENYLFEPRNSQSRESLINNKLLYDLKLAAAENGYFLNSYLTEVDKDGFDIIFDDGDVFSKVQLKTVMKDASTLNWKIHKRLIRPTMYTCESFGFESSPEGIGYQGGIVLIEIDASKNFNVKYYYTDVTILCGFRDSLLDVKNPPSEKAIKTLFTELNKGFGSEKVSISKMFFIEAYNPSSLLALIGLHGTITNPMWQFHLTRLCEPRNVDNVTNMPNNKLINHVNNELKKLSPRFK